SRRVRLPGGDFRLQTFQVEEDSLYGVRNGSDDNPSYEQEQGGDHYGVPIQAQDEDVWGANQTPATCFDDKGNCRHHRANFAPQTRRPNVFVHWMLPPLSWSLVRRV